MSRDIEPSGVLERDGQLMFVPAPPAAIERWAWIALWIAGPIVGVSSLIDAIDGHAIVLSLGTVVFVVVGGVSRARANLRRKRDPHAFDPIPLPSELIDQVRGLNAMRGNSQAVRLIRDRTGLGLADAVTVSSWVQKHPPAKE